MAGIPWTIDLALALGLRWHCRGRKRCLLSCEAAVASEVPLSVVAVISESLEAGNSGVASCAACSSLSHKYPAALSAVSLGLETYQLMLHCSLRLGRFDLSVFSATVVVA